MHLEKERTHTQRYTSTVVKVICIIIKRIQQECGQVKKLLDHNFRYIKIIVFMHSKIHFNKSDLLM